MYTSIFRGGSNFRPQGEKQKTALPYLGPSGANTCPGAEIRSRSELDAICLLKCYFPEELRARLPNNSGLRHFTWDSLLGTPEKSTTSFEFLYLGRAKSEPLHKSSHECLSLVHPTSEQNHMNQLMNFLMWVESHANSKHHKSQIYTNLIEPKDPSRQKWSWRLRARWSDLGAMSHQAPRWVRIISPDVWEKPLVTTKLSRDPRGYIYIYIIYSI